MSLDIEPILESIGQDIIAEMQANLEKNKPGKSWNSMASGNLYGSFGSEVKNNVLEIKSSAEYSGNVDLGRRSGTMPPISSIAKWIQDKGINIRDYSSGRFMSREGANLNRVSYLIARKIKREGYQGINYVLNTFTELKDYIEETTAKKYAEQIEKTLEQNISKRM